LATFVPNQSDNANNYLLQTLASHKHIRIPSRQTYLPATTRDFKWNVCRNYIPTDIYELLREIDAHAHGVGSAIEKSNSTRVLCFSHERGAITTRKIVQYE
jgi:hypothetical protein